MGSSLNLKGGTSTPKSIVETISQANSFTAGDAVRYDVATFTWVKAQADSAENSEVAGVVSANTSSTFDITYSGYISIPVLAGVSAPVLFLDSTTAGGLTASPPSAIGTVVKPVLTKTSNGTGFLVTNYLGTQIGGSSTVAIDEIQPVGTVVPFAGSTIPDSWLECNGNSYAVGAYPYLYSKLQYSSGDRVPAYGHVAVLTTQTPVSPSSIGRFIRQGSTDATVVRAKIIAITATTITVQTVPFYSPGNKNFVVNNTVFTTGFAQDDDFSPFALISAVSITHFNTPDLRGRVALGVNTGAITDTDDDSSVNTTNSAISGIYSRGSAGGQESTVANTGFTTVSASSANGFITSATTTGGLIANMPPYTVVRYIIKASPYTRAAIIDGIDIPYTSLLVGDLRDGSLRPGGSGEPLVFKTNDGSSGVEKMRLTNTGFLGIGTTTPQHTFVVSQGNDTLEFQPGHQTDVSFIQALNRTTNLFTTTLRFRAKDYLFSSGTSSASSLIIDSTGLVNIPSTTESTSPSTGGLTLGGGAGIAKNLTVGGGISAAGGITFSGLTRITNNTIATSPTVAAFTVVGGIGAKSLHVGTDGQSIAGPLNVTGETRVDSAVGSSSTTSGALRVVGGVGIQGALYVGGITTAGGISMGGALTVGGGITAARLDLGTGVMKSGSITTGSFQADSLSAVVATPSTTTGNGALIVAGGAGIGLALNVGGGITAARLDLGSGAIKSGNINCGDISSSGTFLAASLNATANNASTNTGSGSLVVAGGAGIAGALNVGGGITAARLDVSNGIKLTSGGFNTSTFVNITDTAASTSTGSGALIVAGGAGIAGALNVGATATFGGNVGIGTNAPVNKLEVVSNTSGYTGGILGQNAQSTSYFNIIPLGTNAGVGGWTNSSVVFEGIPASGGSGNTIIGSYYQDLVFQTGARANRMRINSGGALIHNGTTSGAVGAISFVPSSANPIYNRIVFGGDNTGYGLAIASQHNTTNAITDRLVLYDSGNINLPITTASTSTTTGALTVAGGAGIAGALHVGGITTAGGITMGGALTVGGAAKINSSTASTTTTSGALTVAGGVGIAGALYVGGITTAGGISMGGVLTVGGGLGVTGGASTFDGSVLIRNSTASDDILSGALQVRGGVGIAGDLSVHAIRVTGNGQTGRGISFGACAMNIPSGTAPMFAARAYGGAVFGTANAVSTLAGSKNITASSSGTNFQVNFAFDAPMPNATYVVMALPGNGSNSLCTRVLNKTQNGFQIDCVQRSDGSGVFVPGFTVDVVVFG